VNATGDLHEEVQKNDAEDDEGKGVEAFWRDVSVIGNGKGEEEIPDEPENHEGAGQA
jgi:hypothetical protein